MRSKTQVIRFLLIASVALATLGATAGAASAKKFITADGNVSCLMRSKFVRCDITKHRWQSPPKPKSCEFDYGSSVGLNKRGEAKFLCVSDAIGATTVVEAGETVEVGPYRCRVRKHGKVFCIHGNSGGFKLGRKSYDLF